MGSDNTMQLVIQVDNSQANDALKSTNNSISVFERQVISSTGAASRGWDTHADSLSRSRAEIRHASEAAHLLGNQIGIELPRAVRRFIGESQQLGTVLSGVFNASIYIAVGVALFKFVEEGIHKFKEWGKESAEVKERHKELTDVLGKEAEKVAELTQKYELLGLAGSTMASAKAGRAEDAVVRQKEEIAATEKLIGQYGVISQKTKTVMVPGSMGETPTQIATKEAIAAKETVAVLKDDLMAEQGILRTLYHEAFAAHREFNLAVDQDTQKHLDELKKRAEQLKREAEAEYAITHKTTGDTMYDEEWRAKEIANTTERIYAETAAIKADLDKHGHDALVKSYDDFTKDAEAKSHRLGSSIVEAWKQANQDAKHRFEETARSIEGFFDRVFLSARSFADVWKQLWMQAVSYVIKQFARMAAAWWVTQHSMAVASTGTGGNSGGSGGIVNSVLGAGGGASGGGGGGGGLFGGLGGTLSKGLGGISPLALPVVGGLVAAGSMSSNWGAKGGLYAAAGLAGLSAAAAAGIGGGTTAMLATSLTIPVIGAIIGGAIAVGLLIQHFHKSAQQKAHEKIKAAYGVDIKDKGVLQQIVEMAKQSYGGNLDMCIRSAQVADLVRLYAMTTGQGTGGLPAQMTSSTFMQSGGGLSLMPTYSNGLPGAGLNSLGASSAGPTVINITVPGAKEFFEKETVTVVLNNSRSVQAASMTATKSNFNRRELTSLQLSPGTLTS